LATAPSKDPGNMAILSQIYNFEAKDYNIISNIVPFQTEITERCSYGMQVINRKLKDVREGKNIKKPMIECTQQ
jgi:hypothetical protein